MNNSYGAHKYCNLSPHTIKLWGGGGGGGGHVEREHNITGAVLHCTCMVGGGGGGGGGIQTPSGDRGRKKVTCMTTEIRRGGGGGGLQFYTTHQHNVQGKSSHDQCSTNACKSVLSTCKCKFFMRRQSSFLEVDDLCMKNLHMTLLQANTVCSHFHIQSCIYMYIYGSGCKLCKCHVTTYKQWSQHY